MIGFIIGLIAGMFFGVSAMCLLVVSKDKEENENGKRF